MRFAIVFTLAAAAVSASASLFVRQTPPTCYDTCVGKANLGNCSSSDASCLCNDASFVSNTTACIEQTCQGSDLTASLQLGQQLCLAVGVTLTASSTAAASTGTPTSSSGSSGSTPASSSSSSSAPATSSSAAAVAHGANTFIGFAAVGLVAVLAL